MFALVDCNNFYCACERLFQPSLRGRPIVVLSNNDGCVISRSQEAKELGLKMTTPIHHVARLIEQHNVAVCSSNYTMYQDMSDRVMATLKTMAPRIEVYSIDEAFVDLSGFGVGTSLNSHGQRIKTRVEQWVGLPVCVGIAPTKTLAKLANHAAKKYSATQGVVELSDPARVDRLLALTEVREIWGIGKRQAAQLHELGIDTALQLKEAPAKQIRKYFSVVMERTQRELAGEVCLELEVQPEARQHILCSRAFGEKQTDYSQVQAALAFHVQRATAKLRKDGSLTASIKVSLKTNPYTAQDAQYQQKKSVNLAIPSDNTLELLKHAKQLLADIWKPGYNYHKVGVVLSDLRPKHCSQGDILASSKSEKVEALMKVIDQLNTGSTVQIKQAATMHTQTNWHMRRQFLSPAYTTRWSDLPTAK